MESQPQGFPNGIDLWADNLGKISKTWKKIAKSTFWGQNSEADMGNKPIFWVAGGSLSVLPTLFVFIWYFIVADLPIKYCQKCKVPKRHRKGRIAI